jgi:hypothetical protein
VYLISGFPESQIFVFEKPNTGAYVRTTLFEFIYTFRSQYMSLESRLDGLYKTVGVPKTLFEFFYTFQSQYMNMRLEAGLDGRASI